MQEKTLLPFASSENNKSDDPITTAKEQAAIFCIAELNRDKGGGLFKKKPPEKIVFLSKVYYPFWIVSLKDLNLVLDGFNLFSHTIAYPTIPEVKAFKTGLEDASSNRQVYSSFLSNKQGYFQESNGENTRVVEGVFSDLEFDKEFLNYIKESTTKMQVADGVLLSPQYSEEQVQKNIREIDDLYNGFAQQREQLGEVIKLLNSKTQAFLVGLNLEIKAIEDKFSRPIEKETAALEKTKALLNKAYTEKVTDVSSKYEKETVALNKEILKWEKTAEELNGEIEKTEIEIKNALINKDEQSEEHLKEKRSSLKKKLPEISQSIKDLKREIQELEDRKKNELFQLRQENEAEIKQASKNLSDIMVARDAEKKICQDEMQRLEEFTSKITGDVDKLCKMMDAVLNDFNNLGVKGAYAPPLLVYMPFYLFSYFSNSEKRFVYMAPSIVNNLAISIRLKALGKKKITQMFQPRSHKIVSILNKFILLLNEDIPFRHEVTEACTKADLLHSSQAIESIKNGLADLRTAGWISEDEYASFSQSLS